MLKRLLAVSLTLAALILPLAAHAGAFGVPPPVPFCQLQIGDVIIAPPGTPQPAGYPFFLTPAIANSFSTEGRQMLGIPPGYTIAVNIFADRAWTGNLPAWLLVPIGTPPAATPALPPPPKPVPAPCPPPVAPVKPPTPPAPVAAPKPCAPAPAPVTGSGGGGLGAPASGNGTTQARRF